MKITIESEELYPVYYLRKETSIYDPEVEISDETFERWEKVMKEFYEVQKEMRISYEKGCK